MKNSLFPIDVAGKLLDSLTWKTFSFFLGLTTLAALIVAPYFSPHVPFWHIWSRVGIPGLLMFLTYTMVGAMHFEHWKREHVQIGGLVVSAFLGTVLSGLIMGRSIRQMFTNDAMLGGILVMTTSGILVGVVAAIILNLREREARSYIDLVESEKKRLELEKAMLMSHLQVLKAQIEPHFLFNTLANVQHLVEFDAPSASRVLSSLIRYLRAAMPEMRAELTTLAKEIDMTRAYLEILKVRMGNRLSFEICIPKELDNFSFPPMMLLTLVENAIKHGVDPCCREGKILVSAECCEDNIQISVTDDGPGIAATGSSGGVGLKNIRERLQAMYGETARLVLSEPLQGGFSATLNFNQSKGTECPPP